MADRPESLYLASGRNSTGVFAKKGFHKGDPVMRFAGAIYEAKNLPPITSPQDDRFVQVGKREYLGPSNDFDDYINHSCDPNAGLVFRGTGEVVLVAIKDISPGEEVAWDYSTTMDEDDWEMDCNCGAEHCRKKIRDFKYLPREMQEKYARLGIVPAYNLKYLSAEAPV